MIDLIYTAVIIILMTTVLVKGLYKTSLVVFVSVLLLYLKGIINLEEVFAGFSNHGMLTVALLYIISKALNGSTGFESFVERLLGSGGGRTSYLRLMVPVSSVSAFLNNTPIVAALIPVIKKWCRKNGRAPSKYLIPLSYAAILGGMCTLIGTSTNLVVHGLLLDRGMRGFSFFELGKVGVPTAVAGLLFFALFGHRLLPERKDAMVQFGEHVREFVVEMRVTEDYAHIGKSIEEANLRHLKGLYLFQIIRQDRTLAPVDPGEKIHLHDFLFFTGLPETIYELQKMKGLLKISDPEFDLKNIDSDQVKTYEVVVSPSSPLAGQTVRDSHFRTKYGAVILGIHRSGKRIREKVGDVELAANDTLFILGRPDFQDRWYHSPDFSLVSQSIDRYSKPRIKGRIALAMVGLMVLAVVTGIVPSILPAAAITAALMMLFGIVSFTDAKNAIDFDVLVVIASAFALGKGVQNSGLATHVGHFLIESLGGLGTIGIIAGTFVLTSLYTELITNNAAAAIMFPIALSTAQQIDMDPRPLVITLAIAASACFSTPLGYQTNLMVTNPGGYRFTDFLKTGAVMNLLVAICTSGIVYLLFF